MFNLLIISLQNLFLQPLTFSFPFLLFMVFVYKTFASKSGTSKIRPPSPRKLPIIGNLHQLGPTLHRSFLSLSQRYGKVMLLHLGNKPTLVVSSVEAIREMIKTHDMIFSNRPKLRITWRLFYDGKDVAFASYGQHWRQMRSISVMHLLSNQKVQSFRAIREDEAALAIEKISRSRSSVNLSEIIISFTNDVVCRAAFGKKYNNTSDGSIIFKDLLNEAMELLAVICLGDFIPCLSWVDRLKGLHGRVEKVAKELDEFLEKVIQEHRYPVSMKNNVEDECDDEGKKVKTFVDILLAYQGENKDPLQIENIKGVILDMFAAGTETNYTLIEWTMSELIRHPRIMLTLKEEVRKIGGPGHKICEDDLEKLTYLKVVMMETLRLHPSLPLLVSREVSKDVKLNNFDIDGGTLVIINAWAIQRDPSYWEEPEEFRPERFLTSNGISLNYKGQDNFQYIPFGAGRRTCPGISFAIVNAELLVANLINEFDWNLPSGSNLDMSESLGITVHKRDPLMVIATPCSSR